MAGGGGTRNWLPDINDKRKALAPVRAERDREHAYRILSPMPRLIARKVNLLQCAVREVGSRHLDASGKDGSSSAPAQIDPVRPWLTIVPHRSQIGSQK